MTKDISVKDHVLRYLPAVNKPARYVGGELNMIRKSPEKQSISVCLAFPDVYDIGQSYIGFHILYHILNKREGTLCERTFAFWPDMEEVVREHSIPLWSLENFLPVSSFDVVGFTLQYELHYTTVLNMLELAGIPLMSCERSNGDPFIIGGGTCCSNPEPVADYFDAFLLGDGEEAFPEILDVIEKCKQSAISRSDVLLKLTEIDGVYVPSLYRPKLSGSGEFESMEPICEQARIPILSRTVSSLKPENYPDRPLVPLCEVVHDRLSVEIMRGCSRGCRFCNAGMAYRPRRARPAKEVVEQIVNGINATGWDEVSLVSLSTTDYEGLEEVVTQIGTRLSGKSVSISLSSLRADNFSLKITEATGGGRKTNLTFAVEAATQRLRDIINKNLTEEQFMETLKTALSNGWKGIKLYFMIGLPTETDEDVLAIADLLNKIGDLLRRYNGRKINVTISPFSPKPMTPFEWEAQDSVAVLRDKVSRIKSNVRHPAINIKATNPFNSMLECRLGRGGRNMGAVILDAYKMGSRLDGWSEFFDSTIWDTAFRNAGIAIEEGGGGTSPGAVLPWSHLNFGVNESYLLKERKMAVEGNCTPDCDEQCQNCGPYAPLCKSLKKTSEHEPQIAITTNSTDSTEKTDMYGRKRKRVQGVGSPSVLTGTHYRVRYAKTGVARFTGHLDCMRIFDRTIRRADIPVAYSQGFHPHPKMSFGPPLSLGMKSEAEYLDITLSTLYPSFAESLARELPEGFRVIEIRSIPDKTDSLVKIMAFAEYAIRCDVDKNHMDTVKEILSRDEIPVTRNTKRGEKTYNVRPGISRLEILEDKSGITALLGLDTAQSPKLLELLKMLFSEHDYYEVTRTEQFTIQNEKMISPLELRW